MEEVGEADLSSLVCKFHGMSGVKEGDRVEVAVEIDRLHFFDPDTGLALTN